MIYLYSGVCSMCASKICRRCAQCHGVSCDQAVLFCPRIPGRNEKHAYHNSYRLLKGVDRRLRRRKVVTRKVS